MITDKYNLPLLVAKTLMSVSHNTFGAGRGSDVGQDSLALVRLRLDNWNIAISSHYGERERTLEPSPCADSSNLMLIA